ncbi:MAG: polysaccharide pyruvyl transferase family protein [Verrucomicrobia bacterium]|nr:polysaccharide pyruvyl transferase family protein [Verrucomicrobiota bacterium]MCH8527343.1 polysaccharide pyruvyl transferase family protein [Kiritimatiellia bacterium]
MNIYAKLGFRFYGAGNVGDDLMLEGFLSLCPKELSLFGVTDTCRLATLKRRFPAVLWLLPHEQEPAYEYWLGVGDTPFQSLSGDYFIRQMEEDILTLPQNIRVALIGVGVEAESIRYQERLQKIITRINLITTRDQNAFTFLTNHFDIPSTRLEPTADLAHVCLKNISSKSSLQPDKLYELALNVYNEKLNYLSLLNIYLKAKRINREHKLVFLSNEFRNLKGSEINTFQTFGILSGSCLAHQNPTLVTPGYFTSKTENFTEVFTVIDRLASSRYHCLLMGAWLGCQCLGINRSSKIQTVCEELQLDIITPSKLSKNLMTFQHLPFKTVSKMILDNLAQKAAKNRDLLYEFIS